MRSSFVHWIAAIILAIVLILPATNGLNSVRKDENPISSGTPDSGVKCTSCTSCENPCNQHPPPPPPPRSPPPPPKSPSKPYCPPPPPAPFIYTITPPGNLYPFDPYFSSASRNLVAKLPILVVCGILGLLLVF